MGSNSQIIHNSFAKGFENVPRGTFEVILTLLFGLFWLLTGCEGKKDTDLVVGMDLSYPPFEMIDAEGNPAGVSVELAKGLADSLGRKLQIENIPFAGLIPSLQNGRIDCIISSVSATEERRKSVDFSDPYLATGLAVLVGLKSPIRSQVDLDQPERTIVVRQGTTGESWARANLKNAKLIVVEKETSAVLEVEQEKADAFIYDQMSIWQNGKNHPETTRMLLAPVRQESWAIAFRKGSGLREPANAFLKHFRESGGFEKLGNQFLSEQKKAFAEEGIPFVF